MPASSVAIGKRAGSGPPLNKSKLPIPVTIPAFAKINLDLRVLGKRADGYHEIDTVLQTISLHDTIAFTLIREPHIILSCNDRSLSGVDNLIHRAAVALQPHAPSKGARIRLDKRIPAHAGLGGGSSNAAVTLLGLSHLWEIHLSAPELNRIAATIGADVPFFFLGGAAQATGTGTTLAPLNDSETRHLLVLKPNANISTAEAYSALNSHSLTSQKSKTILSSSQADAILDSLDPDALKNDFEAVIFKFNPEIERAKSALIEAGAKGARMTGSGSGVFGIFDNQETQERAIQAIELETGWRVFPCMTVGRGRYCKAMGPLGAAFARFSG
jgi:4-diphosphocytidyl-2-C-methyl-D-erythritol kinase